MLNEIGKLHILSASCFYIGSDLCASINYMYPFSLYELMIISFYYFLVNNEQL